jgi:hypothetical protein
LASLKFNLNEGELIPLPQRCLRIIGNAYDMYQILKMIANPNLAHKINFVFKGEDMKGKAGGNSLDMCIFFFDDISIQEAMDLLDHFKIEYAQYREPASELGRQGFGAFKSKLNPPSQSDMVYGQYFKPVKHKLKK